MQRISQKKIKNFIGQSFKDIIILSYNEKTHNVNCKCRCNKIFTIKDITLTSKQTSHCASCAAKKRMKKRSIKDSNILVSERPQIGLLTLTTDYKWITNSRNYQNIYIKCICNCGRQKYIAKYLLSSNKIKSCGCLFKYRGKLNKGKRKYQYTNYKHFAPYYMLVLKSNLKRKNKTLKCNITIEDLDNLYDQQNGLCYYSGRKLILPDFSLGSKFMKQNNYNVSIDRLDSSKNYTKNNIVLCDKEINIFKNKWSEYDFKKLCTEIYNYSVNNKSSGIFSS